MVVAATLDDIPNRFSIDLQVCGEIPAEVRYPDHDETAWLIRSGVGRRDCKEESKSEKNFTDVANRGPHELVLARLLPPQHVLNAPERAMRAELGDFAGGTSA